MKKLYLFIALSILIITDTHAQTFKSGHGVHSTFEELSLKTDTFWNGMDGSGGFVSGLALFSNQFNADWGVWDGWAYSNRMDDTTAGYMNQYSAITAAGYDPVNSGGSNYAVAYLPSMITFKDSTAHEVGGFYVTNATFPALSMEKGDDFAKKFGGASGDEPDWFLLNIWGKSGNSFTDSIEFYLADFRDADNAKDYIVRDWTWVDLSALGKVDTIWFGLSSSDMGAYGMNTPSYFCIDNFEVIPNQATGFESRIQAPDICIFPNPSNGRFQVDLSALQKPLQNLPGEHSLKIYSMTGRGIMEQQIVHSWHTVDISDQPEGIYLLHIKLGSDSYPFRIRKK